MIKPLTRYPSSVEPRAKIKVTSWQEPSRSSFPVTVIRVSRCIFKSNREPFLHTLALIETDWIRCHNSGKEGKGEVELELHFACMIEGSVGCEYP